MDSPQDQPPTEYDDQELLAIINELNENAHRFDNPQVNEIKDFIHAQGLEFALRICSLAVENNAHQNVKYILFANISELLHPRSPPEFLLDIINQFTQLVSKETFRITKIALCRCIANAFFHIVTEQNIQEFMTLFQSLDDSAIYFLYELINVLLKSLDIPMLALKNFLIIVNILPELLPLTMSCFFSTPEIYEFDIVSFYLLYLRSPPLNDLISKISPEISFNVDDFIQQITTIIESNILDCIETFKNPEIQEHRNADCLTNLINFFSMAVVYKIDSQIAAQILDAICSIRINTDNIECFCEMLKKVFDVANEIVTPELIDFLIEMAIDCATQYNLKNLDKILNVLSYLFALLEKNKDPDADNMIFPQLTESLLPLLIHQYPDKTIENEQVVPIRIISMNGQNANGAGENYEDVDEEEEYLDDDDDDDDDDYQDDLLHRSEIIEYIVYFASRNPLPSLGLIGDIFFHLVSENQADYYVCEWVLGLLNTFLQFCSNEIEAISKVIYDVVLTPVIEQNISENANIESIVLDIYTESIEDKQMALSAFHIAVCQYTSIDEIMKKAIKIANEYKFSLIDEIPFDAPLSLKILTILAYNSPSPSIVERIDSLMQTNDKNKMQEATALLKGLQKAKDEENFHFEIENYTIHLTDNQMFAEAIEINYFNPDVCMEIIELAAQKTYEEDVFEQIASKALNAASKNCFGPLSEKALFFVNVEHQLTEKINIKIFNLFLEHKKKIKDNPELQEAFLTEASFEFFVNFARILLCNDLVRNQTASCIFESFIFYFEQVLPLIDSDFWLIIIRFYLFNNMKDVMNSLESYDLLFQFSIVNFDLYHSLLLGVLSEATDNADELFEYLQTDIEIDTQEVRTLYQNKFFYMYKAFDYYRHFT